MVRWLTLTLTQSAIQRNVWLQLYQNGTVRFNPWNNMRLAENFE